MISKFHYITHPNDRFSYEEQVIAVLKGGANWIQYRKKEGKSEDLLREVLSLKKIIKSYKATLIINDYVDLAIEVDADGVHVGKEDEHPSSVRERIGKDKIIGFSTNSYADLLEYSEFDINYFGLGPFKFTTTKQKLSDVIGIEGYETIISNYRKQINQKPIIAIGGIELIDVQKICSSGVYGIAISGAIAKAENMTEMTKLFLKELDFKLMNV